MEKYRGFFVSNVDSRSKAYATAIQEFPKVADWKTLVNHIEWTYRSLIPVKLFPDTPVYEISSVPT